MMLNVTINSLYRLLFNSLNIPNLQINGFNFKMSYQIIELQSKGGNSLQPNDFQQAGDWAIDWWTTTPKVCYIISWSRRRFRMLKHGSTTFTIYIYNAINCLKPVTLLHSESVNTIFTKQYDYRYYKTHVKPGCVILKRSRVHILQYVINLAWEPTRQRSVTTSPAFRDIFSNIYESSPNRTRIIGITTPCVIFSWRLKHSGFIHDPPLKPVPFFDDPPPPVG